MKKGSDSWCSPKRTFCGCRSFLKIAACRAFCGKRLNRTRTSRRSPSPKSNANSPLIVADPPGEKREAPVERTADERQQHQEPNVRDPAAGVIDSVLLEAPSLVG